MSWTKINQFCKVKARPATENGDEAPPRVKFLMEFLDSMSIEYELDAFEIDRPPRYINHWGDMLRDSGIDSHKETNKYYNIVIRGSSDKMVVAHHDIVNPNSDNANDNSASCINAIMTKSLRPDVNIVILDGEEAPNLGAGSKHCAKRINNGDFGNIKWVLNLELTGAGGDNFFIGTVRDKSPLKDGILRIFDCPEVNVPFNDSITFRRAGIDSVNINPLPTTEKRTPVSYRGKYLDMDMLHNCHSTKDSLSTISTEDMKVFTEQVICRIIDEV